MPRTIIVTTPPTTEEIISYEYYMSGSVRVVVGFGYLDETGDFVLDAQRANQIFDIVGSDFEQLLSSSGGKPAGVFRKDDLWAYVDIKRNEFSEKLKAPKDPKI